MNEANRIHRLEGLEPDNLLAFLALLGFLRSVEASDRMQPESKRLRPRASWDLDMAPVRPLLHLAQPITEAELTEQAAQGLAMLAADHNFAGQKDLNYSCSDAQKLLEQVASVASISKRTTADLFSSLMSDAAVKDDKNSADAPVDPTPLCLLFGQGHQHFLERLASVPAEPAPPARGRGKAAVTISAAECLAEALFAPWHRSDPTFSFRWDPDEDVRYALLPGDPTDPTYKAGTQHGANRLATIGLAVLPVAPETRAGRVRPCIPGGNSSAAGFTFRWPIWRLPATLSAIRAILGHPKLQKMDELQFLGVTYVQAARRIQVGKFLNFTRAKVESLTPK